MFVDEIIFRAQGCLLGQLAGDSFGSLVEFLPPERIREMYPDGVRDLEDGGTWDTRAGQPTDDSEMALALARTLSAHGTYDPAQARAAYVSWYESGPFDIGHTTTCGLTGAPNVDSQANGALMRISPLGIFGANRSSQQVAEWARQDAAITHPHIICQQANALFVVAIAQALQTGCQHADLYLQIKSFADEYKVDPILIRIIDDAQSTPPADYTHQQGWVLIAFQNALWQLLHTPSLEEGVIDTVMRGGDTDTNAAICGALLGAVHGRDAIPERWVDKILACRPEKGRPRVHQPRPAYYWPGDALELAQKLVVAGA
ncbi:MAG: ADP-ribosylglycohydrolase family protein [Candidatus Hydrogenedentota bacterium]